MVGPMVFSINNLRTAFVLYSSDDKFIQKLKLGSLSKPTATATKDSSINWSNYS